MLWNKSGLIWNPWESMGVTKAMVPTPYYDDITGELFLFTTCVDSDGVGRPYKLQLDPDSPDKVIGVVGPMLHPGKSGSFDERGVMVTSVIKSHNGLIFMYYTGFMNDKEVRYRLATGLAISHDGGETFEKHSPRQILEFNDNEKYFRSGSFVIRGDHQYEMWYVAGNTWIEFENRFSPCYDLYKIESEDGISWPKSGQIVLRASELLDAFAIGRPWVVKLGPGEFELYFSYRKKSLDKYRLGYAKSKNGRDWDISAIDLSFDKKELDFETDMVCYSAVWKNNSKSFMFYNGNDLGKAGIALAKGVRPSD